MLKTQFKDKLPSFLSYPVGAKAISEAFVGVPQYDLIDLWFLHGKYEKTEEEGRRKVASAKYHRDNLGLSAARDAEQWGLYGPNWRIYSYAVPRDLSSLIREVLHDHGLNLLRDWLAEPRTELWLTSSHSCTLWFDTVTGQLVAHEGLR